MRIVAFLTCLALMAVAACGRDEVRKAAQPEPEHPAAPMPSRTLLGMVWDETAELVALESRTLRRVSAKGVELGEQFSGFAEVSPDGSSVAVFSNPVQGPAGSAGSPTVRFVDARRMRAAGEELVLPGGGYVAAVAWVDRRRLLVLAQGEQSRIVVVDALTRRIRATRAVEGRVVQSRETPSGIVLLLAPPDRIGPARLATVDARGRVAAVDLPGIRAGWERFDTGADHPGTRQLVPGLAVDPAGRLAVVVPPGRLATTVDLRTLAVTEHALVQPVSLLGRLRDWLEPAAEAKTTDGPSRWALWLGDHLVAVTGADYEASVDADGNEQMAVKQIGLELIDTRDWTIREVEEKASMLAVAGDVLLAYGGPYAHSAGERGIGLVAYGADGQRRFHLFGDGYVGDVQVVGPYAYVGTDDGTRFRVVDVRSGDVVRTIRTEHPTALVTETD